MVSALDHRHHRHHRAHVVFGILDLIF